MQQHNLSDILSVIEVSGADSRKYLQGQLTNDINELDTKPFQWSAHLTNKGRILASFIIIKAAEDSYYLITPNEISDKIIPRLKMFVLRSKVSIIKLNSSVLFGDSAVSDGLSIELILQHYISLPKVKADYIEHDSELWKNVLINHGLPFIYLTTQEELTPQQVNYDLLHGVNFKKGCYTGQEIVARTHYLGKVKQRMFRFVCDFDAKIGQKVVSPQFDNQEVGIIVDIVKREYDYMGLVSLKSECAENVFLDLENKQQLLTQPIEYTT